MAKDEEQVTISRKELDALREKSMDPQERKVRGWIREELSSALGDFFKIEDDDDDEGDGEGKRRQSVGGGNILGFLGGSAS